MIRPQQQLTQPHHFPVINRITINAAPDAEALIAIPNSPPRNWLTSSLRPSTPTAWLTSSHCDLHPHASIARDTTRADRRQPRPAHHEPRATPQRPASLHLSLAHQQPPQPRLCSHHHSRDPLAPAISLDAGLSCRLIITTLRTGVTKYNSSKVRNFLRKAGIGLLLKSTSAGEIPVIE